MSDVKMTVETVSKMDFLFRPEEAAATALTAARILAGEIYDRRKAAEENPARHAARLYAALYPTFQIGRPVMIGRESYLLHKFDWRDGELRVYGYRRLAGGWSRRLSRVYLTCLPMSGDGDA